MSEDWDRFRKALRSAIKARLKQLPGELRHAADDAHRDRLRQAQRTLEHALAPTRSDSSKSYLRRTLDPTWWATVPGPRNEAARWAELVKSAVKENGDNLVVLPARIERITAPGSTERQFLNNLWSALGLGIRLARQQNSVMPEHSLAKGSRNLVQLGYRQAALYSIPDRAQWDLKDAALDTWFLAVGGEGRGRLVKWSDFVATASAKGDKYNTVIVNRVIYDYTDDGSAVRDLLLRVWTALGLDKRAERQQGEPSAPSNPHSLGKGSLLQLGHRQALVYDIPDRAAWLAEKRRQYSY